MILKVVTPKTWFYKRRKKKFQVILFSYDKFLSYNDNFIEEYLLKYRSHNIKVRRIFFYKLLLFRLTIFFK